jgi:hypothetical protein
MIDAERMQTECSKGGRWAAAAAAGAWAPHAARCHMSDACPTLLHTPYLPGAAPGARP